MRAVVNGRLIGVPENFYDFVLLKYVTHEPKDEMMIVIGLTFLVVIFIFVTSE